MKPDFILEAEALFDYSQTLRRDFHRHPELGFQEFRTAGIVAKELNKLGLEVTTGVAETGVIALLEGGNPGPVILLRFDMDALPILEKTGVEYVSQNPGVMHACGHDAHTSIGLTVARILNEHREELCGTIKFVFQPAEEGLGGAKRMVAGGVLANPVPEAALALHVWNDKPVGWIGVTPGPTMSASGVFEIVVSGKGGHAASPDQTVDPLVAGAHIVVAAQSIVARNVPPLEGAVLSITTFHGGDAFNVIPEEVTLQGTIRTYKPEIQDLIIDRFEKIARQTAEAMGCSAEMSVRWITPAVINDPELSERVSRVATGLLPNDLIDASERTMGSEDMAYLMDEIPGCFFFIGSAQTDGSYSAPHHNPLFDIDERALSRGAGLMAAAAYDLLTG